MKRYLLVSSLVDDCGRVKICNTFRSESSLDDAKRFLKTLSIIETESSKKQRIVSVKWSKQEDSFITVSDQSEYFWYYYIKEIELADGFDPKEFEES